MEDRRNEKLMPKETAEMFRMCATCVWIIPCCDDNWVITCDGDGKTCDRYKRDLAAQEFIGEELT